MHGNTDTLKRLLEMKADPNLKPVDSLTEHCSALQHCLWHDVQQSLQPDPRIEKIELFLAHRGDPLDSWPKTISGINDTQHPYSTIQHSMEYCSDTIVVLLLEGCVGTRFDPSTKEYAVRNGEFDVQRALYKAIIGKLKESTKFLVTKLGANPNARSPITSRWLLAEATSGDYVVSPQILTVLLDAGANPFVEDFRLPTPHWTITRYHNNSPATFAGTFQVMNDHIRYRLTVLFFRKLRALPSRTFYKGPRKLRALPSRTSYKGFFHDVSKELIQHILAFCIPDTATFRPNIVLEK